MTVYVTRLLRCLSIGKYLFDRALEFAQVIFAKTILVPANSFQEQILDARDGHLERLVPFRVQ